MAVVENETGYKCKISLATNDVKVVQLPKIYIAVRCIFNIFITAFMHTMNLLTRPVYLPCIKVYSENEVCLRFISVEWNLFPSDGQLKKCFS